MKYLLMLLMVGMLVGILVGCGTENQCKYDGLIVVDGNGNKYKLEHRIFDAYFVQEFNKENIRTIKEINEETNKKLLTKGEK